MRQDPYHGVFVFSNEGRGGGLKLNRECRPPGTLPDPETGRNLRIATVEVSGAICPACFKHGQGGYVSFVSDLRLAFACPNCRGFVWVSGA